jgi:hypothetical protein
LAKRPVAPLDGSPLCPVVAGSDDGILRIVNVEDGARFALDPDRPKDVQRLAIEVGAPGSARTVRLRVDGQVIADRGPPFTFDWLLEQGDHVLVAEAEGAQPSAPLRIHVRGF